MYSILSCLECRQAYIQQYLQDVVLQACGVERHGIAQHICWESRSTGSAVHCQATNIDGLVAQAAQVHLHFTQHLLMLSNSLHTA